MFTKKTFIALALSLIMVAVPLASAYAAPVSADATPISCTVQSISTSTDTSGITTVNVTCADGTTVNLSVEQAVALGLVTQNTDGSVTVNDAMVGQVVSITPADVNPCASPASTGEESASETTSTNPVGEALVGFFCQSVGLDAATLQTYRDQGMGYGVIAQACFMAQLLGDECSSVLDAKLNGDYTGLFPDGNVTNWGQLRKAVFSEVLGKGSRSLNNLGAIMSGRAQQPDDSGTAVNQSGKGGGRGNGNGNGRGNGNGHGKP